MKFLTKLTLGLLLVAGTSYADGFGINFGPFNLQFDVNGGGGAYVNDHRPILDNPVCYAISHQKQLEMIVQGTEKINAKEIKITTKRITVEPYTFGVTADGKPVLRGSVIDDKLVKEVTIKYGDPQFDEKAVSTNESTQGYFSGWFKSDKNQTLDLRRVSDIQVIEDSHFDAPKNYKGLQDSSIRVICGLPIVQR